MVGDILLKGCVFFSLPIFTRLLTVNDFGIYNTYIAYEGIISAILGLGLYGTVKNAKLDFKEKFDEYLSSILFLSVLFFMIILGIANASYDLYSNFLGFSREIVNCMLFQSYGSFLIYFYGSKLNIEFKYKSYLIMSFFNTIGNILFSILLIKFVFPNQAYMGRILGTAIPLIIISVFITIYIMLKGKKLFSKKYWKYALLIGLPLVPHVISQSLLSQFDRIMINSLVGSAEAGIYSYIYTMCTIMYVIGQSLDHAWNPWVYIKLDSNNTDEIKRASKTYVDFYTILTIGFICVVPEVLKIVADSSYWGEISLVVPLSLANFFIFLYMIPVGIEYYHKKTKYISLGTLGATITNIVLNYVCIKIFGYEAAAYTTLVSYILLFIFHWRMSKKFDIGKIYELKYILKRTVFLVGVALIIVLCGITTIVGIVARYLMVLAILIYVFKNREKYIKLIKK